MNNIFKIIGLTVISAYSMAVQAIPTLYFDGVISYSADILTVDAQLTSTSGIAPIPNTTGSTLDFTALLSSVDTTLVPGLTIGYFGTNIGTDDLTIYDGDSNLLLTGNFSDLAVFGTNGDNAGSVYGYLNATGGALATGFGAGNLVALQLNLDTDYSATMFDSSSIWSGRIDGNIVGEDVPVPEPGIITMLALGLLLIGFTHASGRYRQITNNNHKAKEWLNITTK